MLRSRGRKEKGFIDIFTTHPSPLHLDSGQHAWAVRLEFDENGAFDKTPVLVPTEAEFDCLCMSAFVYYTNSTGRYVPNHCGYAYVCSGDYGNNRWTAVFHNSQLDSSTAGFALAFRLSGGAPSLKVPYPQWGEVKALCGTPPDADRRTPGTGLVGRACEWYTSRPPLVRDLVNVHVPALPCPFPWLPGFFFGTLRPVGSEDERLFQRALNAAAARRRWVMADALAGPDAAVVVVEALAAIPNCFVYNEDCLINPRSGKAAADEAFYADARTIGNGDCEDAAHELVNAAYSLRTGSWTSDAVRRAQQVLLSYVVAEQMAGVNMDGSGSDVDRYRALPGDASCHIFAHAFVLFLPAAWAARALRLGGSGAHLAPWVSSAPTETLAADGIALFAARALAPFESVSRRRAGLSDSRVEVVRAIGDNYYKYLSSCMLVDSAVECADGSPVYELGYVTGDAYGAHFVDVVNQSDAVALVPVLPSVSAQEQRALSRCAQYFHPIVPFHADEPPPDLLEYLEEKLLAVRVAEPPPVEAVQEEVFLQGGDAVDHRYLRSLGKRLRGTPGGVQYRLDYFAEDTFAVQLYLLKTKG